MINNIETRTINNELAEVRAIESPTTNNRTISGYGIVFNRLSNEIQGEDKLGMRVKFHEIILPSAVENVIEKSDILALLNHNTSRGILARSTNGVGTLKLNITPNGVMYRFEAPNFDLGNELIEGIRRGDIRASSFGFSTPTDMSGEQWSRRDDGTYVRTITKFDKLYDMSPCYREAYQDTTVALRSLDEVISKDLINNSVEIKPIIEEPIIEPIVEPQVITRSLDEGELDRELYRLSIKNTRRLSELKLNKLIN